MAKEVEQNLPLKDETVSSNVKLNIDFIDVSHSMRIAHGIFGVEPMAQVCDVLGILYSKYADQYGIMHMTIIEQTLDDWRDKVVPYIMNHMLPSNGWDLRMAIIELVEMTGTSYTVQKGLMRVKALKGKLNLTKTDSDKVWDLSLYPIIDGNDIKWKSIFSTKDIIKGVSQSKFKSAFGG